MKREISGFIESLIDKRGSIFMPWRAIKGTYNYCQSR